MYRLQLVLLLQRVGRTCDEEVAGSTRRRGETRYNDSRASRSKCKCKCTHRLNGDQRRETWLNGTGFTQFYLPPTRLSTNEMSHPACIS